MKRRSTGRVRRPFQLSELLDLADLSPSEEGDDDRIPEVLARAPRTISRRPRSVARRVRQPRKNHQVGAVDLIVALLRTEGFFELARTLDFPEGLSGPPREYNAISVALWLCLIEEITSFRRIEAFFRGGNAWNWQLVHKTLQEAWPDDHTRRVCESPMSRSQFSRHRAVLGSQFPDKVAKARELLTDLACELARSMGYMRPGAGSLANPDLKNIVAGDGTFVNARTDFQEGDKSTDPEPRQVRFDPDATMGRDDHGEINPGYKWVHFQCGDPAREQESVILAFGRAKDGGETVVAEELLTDLASRLPGLRHYVYDMAAQGKFADRMYAKGIHPIGKLARNSKGEPKNALIEVRQLTIGGRRVDVPMYGVDGVLFAVFPANGKRILVLLTPVAVRPRHRGPVGEYRFPDNPVVPRELVGTSVHIRLYGETIRGRKRAQYLRWINEQTPAGKALLGRRNTTESHHNIIERTLDLGRARSVGESNNTLDLIGLVFARNLRAALAYARRTGHPPGPIPAPLEAAV